MYVSLGDNAAVKKRDVQGVYYLFKFHLSVFFQQFHSAVMRIPVNAYGSLGVMSFQFSAVSVTCTTENSFRFLM